MKLVYLKEKPEPIYLIINGLQTNYKSSSWNDINWVGGDLKIINPIRLAN